GPSHQLLEAPELITVVNDVGVDLVNASALNHMVGVVGGFQGAETTIVGHKPLKPAELESGTGVVYRMEIQLTTQVHHLASTFNVASELKAPPGSLCAEALEAEEYTPGLVRDGKLVDDIVDLRMQSAG